MGLSRDRLTVEEQVLEKVKENHNGVSCEPPRLTTEHIQKENDEIRRQYIGGELSRAQAVPDNVNHPSHYNNCPAKCDCGRRIECIDVTRHMSFNIGNAVKYLWRCELKNSSIEDLRKAKWYIEDEIKERLKNG